jgi:hypothetical protein
VPELTHTGRKVPLRRLVDEGWLHRMQRISPEEVFARAG